MKTVFIELLLLLLISVLSAQTYISAGDVSGIWTLTNSPYYIDGEIEIPDGESLTVEPGVFIEFQGHYEFQIQGQILAEGTEVDSIYFTINDTTGFSNYSSNAGSWGSFEFQQTPATNDSSKFEYCQIEYAKSDGTGGAFEVRNFSKLSIKHCKICNNAADYGGAIYGGASHIVISDNIISNNLNSLCFGVSNILFTNNIVSNNYTVEEDGIDCAGLYCSGNSNPMIINNLFYNNFSQSGGALKFAFYTDPIIVNNLIINNQARKGGAIYLSSECTGSIINNTICGNQADYGGGIYCGDVYTDFENNIVWNNSAEVSGDQIHIFQLHNDIVPSFSYCNIMGGIESFGNGGYYVFNGIYEQNIDENPSFSNETEPLYSLLEISPCIVAGNPDTTGFFLPDFDFVGNPRIINGRIDIGAYEYQGEVIFVLPLSFDPQSGSFNSSVSVSISTETENVNIYYSLDGSVPDENSIQYQQPVMIQETSMLKARAYKDGFEPSIITSGMYHILQDTIYVNVNGSGNFETILEAILLAVDGNTILIADGLYSGNWNQNLNWDGNEKHLIIRSVSGPENCIIDCEGAGAGFRFENSNQTNSDHIEGITIKNGFNRGIICENASPTIFNCIIKNNNGGISLLDSDSKIINNVIKNNTLVPAMYPHWISGGGIFISGGSPFVFGNKIFQNISYTDEIESMARAGGVSINNSNCILRNNLIKQNMSSHSPSGVDVFNYSTWDYHTIIENNTVFNNNAPSSSGIRVRCNTIVRNNIISENSDIGISGYSNEPDLQIENNNVWGHNQNYLNCPEGVGDVSWGTNNNGTACDEFYNITEEPLFVSTMDGDFYLSQIAAGQDVQSPCVDAGSGFPNDYNLMNHTTRTDLVCDDDFVDIGFHYWGEQVNITESNISSSTIFFLRNYPNPFNPSTTISFELVKPVGYEISIYNIKGQKVFSHKECSQNVKVGINEFVWNGKNLNKKSVPSGVYLYRIKTNGYSKVKRMILLK
ncbi:MAG: right-handed parallel beta-helix repeat-containing protein [Candidatus Cloacimonetes bacterium]|nr:right-handed parallel beta-helix repeat-containing protein [Candidatus Cloacimonadota bacterium]